MKKPGPSSAPSATPSTTIDVELYDTTLRDGTQSEGLSLSAGDKLRIAAKLDALGVSYIEAGWPGSNPKDADFFARARDLDWQSATICAFGATRRARIGVDDDPSLAALIDSGAAVCTIFGKSWRLQVIDVLQTSLEENLAMIEESVAFLAAAGRRVFYDAEHFFDGHAADADYALETLRAARRGGAEVVILCDTNGGRLPWEIEAAVAAALETSGGAVGVHCHDDGGLAVANSLAAVRAGATQVQGTINGYGERCGNANLCAVAPDLELKMERRCLPAGALAGLVEVSHFVAEVANLAPDERMPYVGKSAFAHKGGVHVAAMRRNPLSYQHVEPEVVGNVSRVVVSELSGRGNLLSKAEEMGLGLDAESAAEVLEGIKDAEHRGYSFEAAEATVALMLRRRAADYQPPFRVLDYKVLVGSDPSGGAFAEATVRLEVDGNEAHTAAAGDGPVEALDGALRKALVARYPEAAEIQLVDYKVRILDGRRGTAAVTRVLIDSTDGSESWSTVGASTNIIDASCQALIDSIEFGIGLAADAARRVAS
jgi:2-isopropylmalate synthase